MAWLPDGEKNSEDIFIRFGATHERDGRTDGHRVTAYTALMHTHRAVKMEKKLHGQTLSSTERISCCEYICLSTNAVIVMPLHDARTCSCEPVFKFFYVHTAFSRRILLTAE